ncbi:MAG: META domain-containing protein [Treponema sp.]|jgi:heat shock protein HslJ|nr:META domain-containing protein [Treponema sp.]
MNHLIKKTAMIAAIFALLAMTSACKSTPKFSEIKDKEWKLIEVRVDSESIGYDRSKLENESFGDIFTLKFDADRVSGKGAPNRYTAPFELGKGLAITFKPAAATLMAPIREPEKLKEHDFFALLSNVYQWNLDQAKHLEFSTKTEDGREAVMVFE